jgi:predicted transcriptional regulator YheO
VVLHDWSKGYDQSIIAIENGNVTNRKVGDCGSNLGLEILRGTSSNGDRFNYITKTQSDKVLKSSTTYIKDDNGNTLGALCINVDITNSLNFHGTLSSFLNEDTIRQATSGTIEESEFHANNIGQLTDHLIEKGLQLINKPVDEFTKEDKLTVLRYLDEKGTFLITKSGDKVCNTLKISKYTLYSYLDIVRSEQLK